MPDSAIVQSLERMTLGGACVLFLLILKQWSPSLIARFEAATSARTVKTANGTLKEAIRYAINEIFSDPPESITRLIDSRALHALETMESRVERIDDWQANHEVEMGTLSRDIIGRLSRAESRADEAINSTERAEKRLDDRLDRMHSDLGKKMDNILTIVAENGCKNR